MQTALVTPVCVGRKPFLMCDATLVVETLHRSEMQKFPRERICAGRPAGVRLLELGGAERSERDAERGRTIADDPSRVSLAELSLGPDQLSPWLSGVGFITRLVPPATGLEGRLEVDDLSRVCLTELSLGPEQLSPWLSGVGFATRLVPPATGLERRLEVDDPSRVSLAELSLGPEQLSP